MFNYKMLFDWKDCNRKKILFSFIYRFPMTNFTVFVILTKKRQIYSMIWHLVKSTCTTNLLNAIKEKKPPNKVPTPTPMKNGIAFSKVDTPESI